jgi:hypothetical protein
MEPAMLRNAAGVLALVLGLWAAARLPALVRQRWGGRPGGPFVAAWAGALGYALGLAGLLVLWDGGRQRHRGEWVRHRWPGTVLAAVAGATVYAAVEAARARRRDRGV